MTKHRDSKGNIVEVGDRVVVAHCSCDPNSEETPACVGHEGRIDHFVDGRTSDEHNMASIVFVQSIRKNENCPWWNSRVPLGVDRHQNCLLYLSELVLVKSMGDSPQQKKIEACL